MKKKIKDDKIKTPAVVLIGFACSYKSSAGKIAAEKLNLAFFDTDQTVVANTKESVSDIILSKGEARFRVEEEKAALSAPVTDAVVATGGGTVLCEKAMERFKNAGCLIVRLNVSAENVITRSGQTSRPLFDGKTADEIRDIMTAREDKYSIISSYNIDTDGKSSLEIADEIVNLVQKYI